MVSHAWKVVPQSQEERMKHDRKICTRPEGKPQTERLFHQILPTIAQQMVVWARSTLVSASALTGPVARK